MSDNVIEVKNLTKQFDGFKLDNISFSVPYGSIMGFVGQNGAGKTTTIKSILNILNYDSGSIEVFGKDSIKDEIEIKGQIATVFDEVPFHNDFNAIQLCKIMSSVFKEWDKDCFFKYLERFSVPIKKKIGDFSKGMKMKLQIAVALSHNAKLLIMDEPTTGLDPVIRSEILEIFLEFLQDEKHSIFLSSHITSDLEKIADSITFIDKGKILLSGNKDDILINHGIVKCSKDDYKKFDKADFISARLNDFGAEIMVCDKNKFKSKYKDLVIDNANLDDIMVFYVNSDKKEWR